MPPKPDPSRHRHVFTDVDNTLIEYGGGKVYPGGVRFVHELRADMDDPAAARCAPKVTVLSARPGIKGVTDSGVPIVTDGAQKLLTVDGKCIYGETLHGKPHKALRAMGRDIFPIRSEAVARCDQKVCNEFTRQKVENVKKWKEKAAKRLLPGINLELVLVGDNGEGDAEAAQRLLVDGDIQWAFIRRVKGTDRGLFHEKQPSQPALVHHEALHYFEDYAEAAHIACLQGLLSDAAHARVVAAAQEEGAGAKFQLAGLLFTTKEKYDESRQRSVPALLAGYVV